MINKEIRSEFTLEPRVAKLEVGLDRLTEDIKDLANIVRVQGSQSEAEIQKLVVAVTQAAGPRKTDWSVISTAGLLIMAIGSAIFWPLNQTAQNSKDDIKALQYSIIEHEKMDNHPVGASLISHLERRVTTLEDINNKKNEQDKAELELWRQKALGLILESSKSK